MQLNAARNTFLRAPVCVMVVSTAAPHAKIPEWEQQLSAGAVCFALLIAAHAMGYGGCWLTGWPGYDARARAGAWSGGTRAHRGLHSSWVRQPKRRPSGCERVGASG